MPRRPWGLREDLPRLLALVLGSLVLALALYAWHPLSPPLAVYGARQAQLPAAVGRDFRYVTAREAWDMLSRDRKAHLCDVREPADYLQSHAAGAWSLSKRELRGVLPGWAHEIAPDSPCLLYAYGENSPLAVKAIPHLKQLGLRHLYLIRGGFEEWQAEGLPTETGPQKGPK